MAKKIVIDPGTFRVVDGKKSRAILSSDELLSELFECCGPDCCRGVYKIKDQATGEVMAIWVENGVMNVDTLAAFDAAH